MLKISIKDDSPMATLKIEGKLVGPWAMELGRTWHDLWASANQMPLRLDIRGVTFADEKGSPHSSRNCQGNGRGDSFRFSLNSILCQPSYERCGARARGEITCRPQTDKPRSVKLAS